MNNHSPDTRISYKREDASGMIRFGRRQVHGWVFFLMLGGLTAGLSLLVLALATSLQVTPQPPVAEVAQLQKSAPVVEKPGATAKLINKLKQYGLWKIHPEQEVPPFFISSYPADLYAVDDISVRKRVFLHSLLPHALYVRQEALHKRNRLESILGKIDCPLGEIDFDAGLDYESQCSWTDFLLEEEVNFIENLCSRYRTTSAAGLLERVDAVPTSIILAQGALESSWGSSRFTREGNSIFGMWTRKTKGMVPTHRDEGKTHKVKAYANVLESVRAYQLTLNRLDSYEGFRKLRMRTDDPLVLADGLTLYSERGEDYVEDIKKVILTNDLQKYDSCSLSDQDLSEFTRPLPKITTVAEYDKASL